MVTSFEQCFFQEKNFFNRSSKKSNGKREGAICQVQAEMKPGDFRGQRRTNAGEMINRMLNFGVKSELFWDCERSQKISEDYLRDQDIICRGSVQVKPLLKRRIDCREAEQD